MASLSVLLRHPGRYLMATCYARMLSNDLMAALRPFYLAIKPSPVADQMPAEEKSLNEKSLRQLSSHLESLSGQSKDSCLPADGQLKFYMYSMPERESTMDDDQGDQIASRLVRIQVDRSLLDPRAVIKNILRSCKLLPKDQNMDDNQELQEEDEDEAEELQQKKPFKQDTKAVNELEKVLRRQELHKTERERVRPPQRQGIQKPSDLGSTLNELLRDPPKKEDHSLDTWMRQALARAQAEEVTALRAKIDELERSLVESLGIRGTRYDCGWNMERYHDCLQSLKDLVLQDPEVAAQLRVLANRFVVFAPYTGISLEGDVMLFSGDAPASWLAFLSKQMRLHEEQLRLVPLYEKALSAVLLGIKIQRRRAPVPGCEARAYADSLRRVIRAVSEHLKLEESVRQLPATLQDHQLVVMPDDSDTPKVSQTGLFLAPASCPGPDLVAFICRNLDVASVRVSRYRQDMEVERKLWRQCQDELGLQRLSKDDSVTPDKMVKALEHLLKSGVKSCRGLSLHITNYWSVPTDGIVCIPWNFMMSQEQE
ncbi:LOW QUALITY PROTEIN: T-cell activation inhibitor, mitochondrial [Drosophila serrata]|uniref:LOW QUALITY PROTEIN: T-cell activation inhibitor, mitochondrial n=1 Tax=Drosophila serrata TaxID=7274 RepID=UPI000A1D2A06|nr:LOW QUALITY PROTEIN: T-cell activation inhibitor, mitochondrial [Drosophila serrata]